MSSGAAHHLPRSTVAGKRALAILGVLLLLQSAVSCASTPTGVPAPTERVQSVTPTKVATRATPSLAPTPSATLTLSPQAEQELTELRDAIRGAQGGFLFYLDAPGRTSNPQVFNLPPDEPFDAIALAGNYGVKDHSFALLCIVDYVQTPCRREAGEKTLLFSLASDEETRMGLDLTLSPGAHDVLFLTFVDPADHSADPVFRQDSRFLFAFHRVRVIVGDQAVTSAPQPGVGAAPPSEKFATKDTLQPGAGLFTISRDQFSDPSQPPWHREEIAPGAPLNYFAAYSNAETVPRTLALMTFLDYAQVPWDATHATFFAELDPGARADVPAVLFAPTAPGDHELIVVAVDNPFLDLSAEVAAAQPRSFFAHSSDRVLILVP